MGLVQVLGEQLIASERVGILELVKNAFDAGARSCNVRIEKIPDLPAVPESLNEFNEFDGPVIVVEDDGSGMTKEEIVDHQVRGNPRFAPRLKNFSSGLCISTTPRVNCRDR